MTDTLHERLADLADIAVPSLDVTAVFAAARTRRRRAAAAASAAVLGLAVAGAATAAVLSDMGRTSSLQPATPSPHRSLVPSEVTLRAVLDRVVPGSRVADVQQFPAAYLPAGSSAFDRRSRLGRVTASVTTPDGGGFSVAWDALDRPLDTAESVRFVEYTLAYDKQRPAPSQVLLRQQSGSRSGLRLYRIDDALPGAQLVLDQWAGNGANVVLRRRLNAGASDRGQQAAADVLLRVGTALVSDAPAGHTASAGDAPQPSEKRLRQVGAEATPPIRISQVTTFPGGPVTLPGRDAQTRGCCAEPWGAPGRTSTGAVGNGRTGDAVHVTWTVVSPPLSDFEGDRLASGWGPPDPGPAPAPTDSVKIGGGRDGRIAWSAYSYAGAVHAVVWARDGGLAILFAPAEPADTAARDRLVQTGRALLTAPSIRPRTLHALFVPPGLALLDNGPNGGADRARFGVSGAVGDQRQATDLFVTYNYSQPPDTAAADPAFRRSTMSARGTTVEVLYDPQTRGSICTWTDPDGYNWQVSSGSGLSRDDLVRFVEGLRATPS